jgi:excinuclease ABC subunit B
VIFYADRETGSMRAAIDETGRRRNIQLEYNKENGITPTSIKKEIKHILETVYEADYVTVEVAESPEEYGRPMSPKEMTKRIEKLRKEMLDAAGKLDFEKAAKLRDEMLQLEKRLLQSV